MGIKVILILAVFISPVLADLSISQMDIMVQRIKSKRKGNAGSNISKVISPFALISHDDNTSTISIKEPEKESIVFKLGAIVNDKVFVNNHWLKRGDKISGYEMVEIKDNSVKFVQGKRMIEVFLKKSKKILQLNEE